MTLRALAAALALLAAWACGPARACGDQLGPQARRIDAAQVQLAYRLRPDPVPVGRHFAIDIVVCPKGNVPLPAELRVDATMPEHRHGMNYRPSIQSVGPGQYRAEGLLFHMPGRWELVFELRDRNGPPQRLTQSLQVG